MRDTLARLADRLPSILIDTLRSQWGMLGKLDAQNQEIEQ
jgi:transposase